jgi:hypothetical protein
MSAIHAFRVLVALATTFCVVVPNIWSIIISYYVKNYSCVHMNRSESTSRPDHSRVSTVNQQARSQLCVCSTKHQQVRPQLCVCSTKHQRVRPQLCVCSTEHQQVRPQLCVCSKHQQVRSQLCVCSMKHQQIRSQLCVCSKHQQARSQLCVCSKHQQARSQLCVCSKHQQARSQLCVSSKHQQVRPQLCVCSTNFLHDTLLAPKSGGSSYSLENLWALSLCYTTQCFSRYGPRVDSIVLRTTHRFSL